MKANQDDQPVKTPADWSRILKSDWEQRARYPARDFYVASHPGWNDPEAWKRQADVDLKTMLHGLEADVLSRWHVLELGCGVGRLALPLGSRVRSYTGVDIAPGMIEEAKRRCGHDKRLRFLVNNGISLPEEACDRKYELILAVAVFIHCPRPVIEALIKHSYEMLAPGGQLRFQIRADLSDPVSLPEAETVENVRRAVSATEETVTDQVRELIDDHYYMGDTFGYDELVHLLGEWTGGNVMARRLDPDHIYGWIQRSPHQTG